MSRNARQNFWCNNCGRKLYCQYAALLGRKWRVCSSECHSDMEMKYAKSILGHEDPECLCPAGGTNPNCPAHHGTS